MVTSDLETAVIECGIALRASAFGQALGRWNPRMRCTRINDHLSKDCTALAQKEVELGIGPPIRSTFAAIQFAELVEGQDVAASDPEYVRWVQRAHWALQRIAGKCWAPIPQRFRSAIADVDDLGPLISAYIPESRRNELGPALRFEGLDSPPVTAALEELVKTIHRAPVHEAVREVLALVGTEERIIQELQRDRTTVLRSIRGTTTADLRKNPRQLLEDAYREIDSTSFDIVQPLWSLNELINHTLWALLSYTDRHRETPKLTEGLGSIRVTVERGRTEAHFTLWQEDAAAFILGALPYTFEVNAKVPLDGLYLSTATSLQFGGFELMDVMGQRLADLERPLENE